MQNQRERGGEREIERGERERGERGWGRKDGPIYTIRIFGDTRFHRNNCTSRMNKAFRAQVRNRATECAMQK